ncbi:hypothetical protein C0993_007376 [Termitomyces sp. T159_Od127]|nr:hypothetical protein C0993_007376 [Termitomyces sp. T159_Od127]
MEITVLSGKNSISARKKAVRQKSRIRIAGFLENVEEAKRRILSQLERLVSELSNAFMRHQYHAVFTGGRDLGKPQDPQPVPSIPHQSERQGKTRESIKAGEVLIKGGKKGVAGAKSEVLEVFEFEKESNNIIEFTVPARSVARVLGRGGASFNEIKDTTGAAIDVEKPEDGGVLATVTVRDTKKVINAAKGAILAIADQVADPRQGEPSNEVKLHGEPRLVNKLKAELKKIVAALRDHVILGVDIPVAQHRVLIGRGGQRLNELQPKWDVQIQFPGSRS